VTAASFTVNSGSTTTTASTKTLSGTDTGTVQAAGTLNYTSTSGAAITISTPVTGVIVDNSGTIISANRGLDTNSGSAARTITFTNSGTLTAADDAFRINGDVPSGTIVVNNAGTMTSNTGQVIDFAKIVSGTASITINNLASGRMQALDNDAVRPGQNGVVNNWGIIIGSNSGTPDSKGIGSNTATNFTVYNYATGYIEGAKSGIKQTNAGASNTLTVFNYGTIVGKNGSGVGSDGSGTVFNYGTITGNYAGSGNGDGDGVDIDYIGTIVNYGTIKGTGAGGVDANGNPNHSQGIAMGGGSITNNAGGLIEGANQGIMIDDGSGQSAYGAVMIDNAGTIRGLVGAAITIVGNYANTIVNSGLIEGAGSEPVIGTGDGDDTVTNSGIIIGSIDLGAGTNAFNNEAGGLVKTGNILNVGEGHTVLNAGTLSPGGDGIVKTTSLSGNLEQTATGVLAIDLGTAGEADHLDISGTAELSGQIKVALQSFTIMRGEATIISAAGGVSTGDLWLINPYSTPAVWMELLYPDANNVVLSYAVSFAPTNIDLNANQFALGSHINTAFTAGSAGVGDIASALLGVPTAEKYKAALDALSPEVYAQTGLATLLAAESFSNALMSCRVSGAAYIAVSEGQCLWIDASHRDHEQDRTATNIGFSEESWRVAGGAQVRISEDLALGFAAGAELASGDMSNTAHVDGDRGFAGIALKNAAGPLLLAGSLSGGIGSYDTLRTARIGDLDESVRGREHIDYLSGRLRAGYQFGDNSFYAKPLIDLTATQLWFGSVHEQGGSIAFNISAAQDTFVAAAPALEIGGEIEPAAETVIHPYIRGGVLFRSENGLTVTSAFEDVPDGISPFATKADLDGVVGTVSAGFDVMSAGVGNLKLYYDGMFGDSSRQHAFGGKASLNF
jgi:hypothetical protein